MAENLKVVPAAPAEKQVAVRFLIYDGPYQAGQVAQFSPACAEKLVRNGVAEEVHG